jgi:hypothetical protein
MTQKKEKKFSKFVRFKKRIVNVLHTSYALYTDFFPSRNQGIPYFVHSVLAFFFFYELMLSLDGWMLILELGNCTGIKTLIQPNLLFFSNVSF